MNIGFCDRIEFCGDSCWTSCANRSEEVVTTFGMGRKWRCSEGGVIDMASGHIYRSFFSDSCWIGAMLACVEFAILFFPALIIRTINRWMYTFKDRITTTRTNSGSINAIFWKQQNGCFRRRTITQISFSRVMLGNREVIGMFTINAEDTWEEFNAGVAALFGNGCTPADVFWNLAGLQINQHSGYETPYIAMTTLSPNLAYLSFERRSN